MLSSGKPPFGMTVHSNGLDRQLAFGQFASALAYAQLVHPFHDLPLRHLSHGEQVKEFATCDSLFGLSVSWRAESPNKLISGDIDRVDEAD